MVLTLSNGSPKRVERTLGGCWLASKIRGRILSLARNFLFQSININNPKSFHMGSLSFHITIVTKYMLILSSSCIILLQRLCAPSKALYIVHSNSPVSLVIHLVATDYIPASASCCFGIGDFYLQYDCLS